MSAPDPRLVAAGRAVLDRDGFFGTTFDAVAAEAGVPVAEVEAAFPDVPRLFLAAVDEFLVGQMAKYDDEEPDAPDFAAAMRAYGRRIGRARMEDGVAEWDRVLVEFWIFATRTEPWRGEVRRRNTANLDRVGAVLGRIAARYGLEWTIPLREAARGLFSLGRGMGLEAVMDPDIDRGTFEQMFTAYATGLVRPAEKEDGQ